MPNTLVPVKFHEDTIYYVDFNGEQYTPVKPIVENLGLSWGKQTEKLQNTPHFNCSLIAIVAQDGKNREMLCIPVRKLTAFLYSVNVNKVREDLRDKLLRYQEECDEVLWQYWTEGHVTKESVARAIDKPYVEALEYFYRNTCKVEGVQVAFAVDRAWKRIDGNSPLELGGIQLQAQSDDDDPLNYVTVTKIAEMFGLSSAQALNPILTGLGLQDAKQKYKRVKLEDGTYERDANGEIKQVPAGFDYTPTELGKQHGGKRLPKKAGDAPEKWNLYWHKDKLPAYLREVYFKETNENEED